MKGLFAVNRLLILLFWVAFVGIFPAKAQNSVWKCVKHKDDIWVYSRKSDTTNFRVVKVTTQLKTTLSSLVRLVTDFPDNKNWVFLNEKTEILKKENPHLWILYSQTDAPWPVTDRDIVSKTVLSQDSVTKIVTIRGEAIPKYRPIDPNYVRIPFARSQWRFIPLKDSLVEIEFKLELDVGGNIPQWLANMAATEGPYQTIRRFRKEIQRKKYRDAHLSFIKEP